nr:MAG TPA: Protein of unknown function (DUF3139) [Caudoviricetes sp.]
MKKTAFVLFWLLVFILSSVFWTWIFKSGYNKILYDYIISIW